MRRRQRAFLENSVSPGEMLPWEDLLAGASDYRPVRDPAAPFPAAFCGLIMVLSSLMIYGAIYSVLALLN